jgi:hypothetical protein
MTILYFSENHPYFNFGKHFQLITITTFVLKSLSHTKDEYLHLDAYRMA